MANVYDRAPRGALDYDHDDHAAPAHEAQEPARWPGKRTGVEAHRVSRSAIGVGTPGKVSRAAIEATAARSQGERLPRGLEQRLERRLGADLSSVRAHTGSEAAESARDLSARAYTLGQNVYFGAGTYDPDSPSGQRLIAHEVAHTVQQQGASTPEELDVSSPGDSHEHEADDFADRFVSEREPLADREPSIAAPEDGPHVVQAARLQRVARVTVARVWEDQPWDGYPLRMPKRGPHGGAMMNPIDLFDQQVLHEHKPKNIFKKKFPILKGAMNAFGLPLTYDLHAKAIAQRWAYVTFGPGKIEDIELGANRGDNVDKFLGTGFQYARGTARVAAHASAGINASMSVGGELDLLAGVLNTTFEAGLRGKVKAAADAKLQGDVALKFNRGHLSPLVAHLQGGLDLSWQYSLEAFVNVTVTLKLPEIPVVSDALRKLDSWPIVGWIVPNPDNYTWTTHLGKTWPIFDETVTKPGSLYEMSLSGKPPFPPDAPPTQLAPRGRFDLPDLDTKMQTLFGKTQPDKKKDWPTELGDNPKDEQKVRGADSGTLASTREGALAQIASAKVALAREHAWDKEAEPRIDRLIQLARKRKADEKAAAEKAAAEAAKRGGPQLATYKPAAPVMPGQVGGSGALNDPELVLNQAKARIAERKAQLKKGDRSTTDMETKLAGVKGAGIETAAAGPARNQAKRVYDFYEEKANDLGNAARGTKDPDKVFTRPEIAEPAPDAQQPAMASTSTSGSKSTSAPKAKSTATQGEAKRKREQAFRKVDEEIEVVRKELLWCNEELANLTNARRGQNMELQPYAHSIGLRRDEYQRLVRELEGIEKQMRRGDQGDLAAQAAAYDAAIAKADGAVTRRKSVDGARPRPRQEWDKTYVDLIGGQLLLKEEYAKRVRSVFYPRSYRAPTKRWMKDTYVARIEERDGADHWYWDGELNPRRNDYWWHMGMKGEMPTIDHDDMSVAVHWENVGRYTDKAARIAYYNGWGDREDRGMHLAVVPGSRNSSLGSTRDRHPYQREVGVKFKGR